MRFGTGEAVQGFFPLLFVTVFLSSSNLPRNLIQVDWFREVATYNPVSYLIEGVRSLTITGWAGEALAPGFGLARAVTAPFPRNPRRGDKPAVPAPPRSHPPTSPARPHPPPRPAANPPPAPCPRPPPPPPPPPPRP